MFRFLCIALFALASSAYMAPLMPTGKLAASKVVMGGKGFGGGEATRDPEPTVVDPNDPKGKQQAIHKAESFADSLARRKAEEGKAGDPKGGSRSGSVNMVLEPGLTVPADLKLQEGPFPPMEINLDKRFADKNVVLVGLPGAFTPT